MRNHFHIYYNMKTQKTTASVSNAARTTKNYSNYTNSYCEYSFENLKDCLKFILEMQLAFDSDEYTDIEKQDMYYDLFQLINSDVVVRNGYTYKKNQFKEILVSEGVSVEIEMCAGEYEVRVSGVEWGLYDDLSTQKEEKVFVNKSVNNYMMNLIERDNNKKNKTDKINSMNPAFFRDGIITWEIKK